MIVYQEMDDGSDVAVVDTEQFGDNGIEIHTRDGRDWSGLSVSAAIEQLSILADKYGQRVPDQCIARLQAQEGWQLMVAQPLPIDLWGLATVQ